MTNYDGIKAMEIDKLSEFLCDNFDCNICPYCLNGNLTI